MNNLDSFIKDWMLNYFGIVIQDHQISRINYEIQQLIDLLNISSLNYIEALIAQEPDIVKATIDICTVPESYFFRDPNLFSYLQNSLLPELINAKRKNNIRQLNIWSVGCACGEEAYSIAICLDGLLEDINEWSIILLATDINEVALDKGRKGIFTKSSMRAIDANIEKKYFDYKAPFYYLKENIRNRVNFKHLNIAKLTNSSLKYDLIFCRNVFIYLTTDIIQNALKFFYESLTDGGVIFLGATDILSNYQPYSKVITKDLTFLKKSTDNKNNFREEDKVDSSFSKIIPPKSPKLIYSKKKDASIKEVSIGVLTNKNNSIAKCDETALFYRYQGEALIGLGDIPTAEINFLKSINLDPLDAVSHFMLGLIELDKKNNDKAIILFQKALYLKTNFAEAAYYLGLVYLQNKQMKQGFKSIQQALIYAKAQGKKSYVLGEHKSLEQFIAAIESTISFYQGKDHE